MPSCMLMLAVSSNWNTLKQKKTTPSTGAKMTRLGKMLDAADVRSARARSSSEKRHDE